jgi:hypothetical protein
MAYQAVLVKAAGNQHMRRFSAFLALPSATIRLMASRQLVVGVLACGGPRLAVTQLNVLCSKLEQQVYQTLLLYQPESSVPAL